VKLPRLENPAGDFWGGMAAMMVALPSAIAYGVTIYSVLGSAHVALGALAGILGAVAMGIVASSFGGTRRLISAPCAPAAAVVSAFAIDAMARGTPVDQTMLLLTLLGLLAGLMQVMFGALRLGLLIKYMPYTVVSGYLSGVGLIIIASQVPKLLGTPKGMYFWSSLLAPDKWRWQAIVVGLVTIAVMVGAPRVTKAVPAAILGLASGIAAYFGLGLIDPALLSLPGNTLVVGALGGEGGGSFWDGLVLRWSALTEVGLAQLQTLAIPALTLAVLLSIDTLKSCVVLDALTRTRHNSNRELIGQGLANLSSGAIGGIPGAGTMGATLVNVSGGASTSFSGLVEGVLSLFVFLLLTGLIAWVPVSALAGILIVIGTRMIDRNSLLFLKSRSTILDFAVIVAVIGTALTVSLIAASGVGVVLAVVLFIREQIGGSIIRRKLLGNETFSKRVRTHAEMEILTEKGARAAIVELQGSLFFGTADQLYRALEADLKERDFLILDMRRIQTVDVTAAHLLEQVKDMLAERHGYLIFSQIPESLPSGRDLKEYFDQVGLLHPDSPVRVFPTQDDALEWVEDRIIHDAALTRDEEVPLELHEVELFEGRKEQTLAALEQCMEKRHVAAGEKIFSRGDAGDELFLIRRGAVRIVLPLSDRQSHHIGTFGRGAFFGEMAFLDGEARSANAVAFNDCELYVLSRKSFDKLADEHRKLGLRLMEGIASVLASRLRYTNAELRVLES
jgi:SulP family sulfate permease